LKVLIPNYKPRGVEASQLAPAETARSRNFWSSGSRHTQGADWMTSTGDADVCHAFSNVVCRSGAAADPSLRGAR